MKNEIKVGSRVRCVVGCSFAEPGEIGTVTGINGIVSSAVAVEWDNNVGGHNNDYGEYNCPTCKDGHGEFMSISQLELITEESK